MGVMLLKSEELPIVARMRSMDARMMLLVLELFLF
jgi:hypothetical protein